MWIWQNYTEWMMNGLCRKNHVVYAIKKVLLWNQCYENSINGKRMYDVSWLKELADIRIIQTIGNYEEKTLTSEGHSYEKES